MAGSEGSSRYVLLTDQPWIEGDDPLDYVELADRLAALVLDSRHSTPLAIGVLGGWGSGKSTLMRRLDTRLRQRDCEAALVETVWFNAWTADMTPQDVRVRTASSRSAAADVLSEPDSLIDFLVVDVRQGRDPGAGFDELAYIRNNGLYTGPAVFYASRITPEQRARATELRATITTSFADVLRRLGEVAETKVGSWG